MKQKVKNKVEVDVTMLTYNIFHLLTYILNVFLCCVIVCLISWPPGSGTVEFNEFTVMMSRRREKQLAARPQTQSSEASHRKELQRVFQVFDIDGDGLIDAKELRKTMENLQVDVSEDDVRAMITEADKNGDGKVDLEGLWKVRNGVFTRDAHVEKFKNFYAFNNS